MDPLRQIDQRMGNAISKACREVDQDVTQLDNIFGAALREPFNPQRLAQDVKIEALMEDLNYFHELYNNPQSVSGDPLEYRLKLRQEMDLAFNKYKTILATAFPPKKKPEPVPPAAAAVPKSMTIVSKDGRRITTMHGVVHLNSSSPYFSSTVIKSDSSSESSSSDSSSSESSSDSDDCKQISVSAYQERTFPAYYKEARITAQRNSVINLGSYSKNLEIVSGEYGEVTLAAHCKDIKVTLKDYGRISLGAYCKNITITFPKGKGVSYNLNTGCKKIIVNGEKKA